MSIPSVTVPISLISILTGQNDKLLKIQYCFSNEIRNENTETIILTLCARLSLFEDNVILVRLAYHSAVSSRALRSVRNEASNTINHGWVTGGPRATCGPLNTFLRFAKHFWRTILLIFHLLLSSKVNKTVFSFQIYYQVFSKYLPLFHYIITFFFEQFVKQHFH